MENKNGFNDGREVVVVVTITFNSIDLLMQCRLVKGVEWMGRKGETAMRKEDRKQKVYIRNLGHAQQQKSATRVPRKTRKREHQQRASNKFHLFVDGCLFVCERL